MLFLLFQIGTDRYAIEATRVVEVLPLVRVKLVPQAPRGVAGVINYRGTPVPVVDVSACACDRPAQRRLSTRLLIVRLERAARQHLALLAEQATESLRLDPASFTASGVRANGARYLGPVAPDAEGRLLQWVEVENLLSDAVRDALFQPVASET